MMLGPAARRVGVRRAPNSWMHRPQAAVRAASTAAVQGKVGVLLTNLGTPSDCTPPAVAEYLREFLADSNVVQQPWLIRFILANLIATFRSKKSAEAYSTVWLEGRGSPLLAYSDDFTQALHEKLKPQDVPVELAMRYARPTSDSALGRLKEQGCDRIVCLPMYPHETGSTTVTAVDAVKEASERVGIDVDFVPAYWEDNRWVDCVRALTGRVIEQRAEEGKPFDHVLFSFHSVPLQHIRNMENLLTRLDIPEEDRNRRCYHASTIASAHAIAKALDIPEGEYSISFQSRLGSQKWLTPSTDETLKALGQKGVKRLAILAPGFSVDNLETLEELRVEGAETFVDAGGESLELINCVNADPLWVDTVHDILAPYISGEKAGGDRIAIPSHNNVPYKIRGPIELLRGFR